MRQEPRPDILHGCVKFGIRRGVKLGASQIGGLIFPAQGAHLFVGQDIGDIEAYLARLTQALWGAMVMVLVLGVGGGLWISRGVERAMGGLNQVVTAVQEGDLKARAPIRHSGDELDELGQGLNTMLDRMEASMASIRHAGAAVLGPWSPVAAGDYAAGPSHVLPTGGTARFAAGLSANEFLRGGSVIHLAGADLAAIAADIGQIADTEGLTAHRRSVEARTSQP